MKRKFKASYDQEGDVLTIYRTAEKVKESIEVAEDLVIDVDKNMQLINLELIDAYKFLHTLNNKISREMLRGINEAELDVKNYRNYLFITLIFKHNNKIIKEKLPAFASSDFKSPLIASAAA
jgi:uncharacterized protein YuzE